MNVINYENVESKIVEIRGQKVIIDSDVAELYGVKTKEINQAVKNNPEKFPGEYVIELNQREWEEVRSKILTSPLGGGKVRAPKAFAEKGLYMLATILKSPKATETTLAIIDTFSKVRELGRMLNQLPGIKENSPEQHALLQRAGEVVSDLIIPEKMKESETSIELNLAIMKLKYSVKNKGLK